VYRSVMPAAAWVMAPVAAAETDETDETGSLRRIVGAVLPHIRPPRH
jgi:hypothetical protein